jgi:hypothetical protein
MKHTTQQTYNLITPLSTTTTTYTGKSETGVGATVGGSVSVPV